VTSAREDVAAPQPSASYPSGENGAVLDAGQRPVSRAERLRTMLQLIENANSTVAVEDLTERLAVSAATVRRDLAHLANQGLVSRSYGGATPMDAVLEVPVYQRGGTFAAEKERIGTRAAEMITEGAVVGITGGTTTMQVARAIESVQDLTVVTNALDIGYKLARRRNIRLVLTGGICRPTSFEMSGPIAESTLEGYHLDMAFVGVDGIDAEVGCTTHDDIEARANMALVQRARRNIVVADHSKIGRRAFASICSLQAIDVLVTDDAADPDEIARFEAEAVRVILA
jgi:DeoR family transcriptional regulator, aga operon transcriptional repressor